MVASHAMLSRITGIISESLITSQQEYRPRKEQTISETKKDEEDEHNNVEPEDAPSTQCDPPDVADQGTQERLDLALGLDVHGRGGRRSHVFRLPWRHADL
mmetsp:Transcript_4923/g.18477  ORF Transcript_4923/g.18477 Transcript_4923/m.18477 type:complete len:101 (+) Transcript_4923:181-483(+)